MNTTVPDKRNAPLLVIFWDPVDHPSTQSTSLITKNVVWHNKKLIFTVRICRRLMKRVKRSEVGYLRFLTRVHKKNGQVGAERNLCALALTHPVH